MAYLTRSEQIQLPPPSVFACLVDLAEAPRWRPLVERMEVVGGGELKVGAVVRVVYRIAGKTQERSFVVTDYDPPRAMAWRRDVTTHDWVVRYTVEPASGGSSVTMTITATAVAWLDRLKLWLNRGAQRRQAAAQLTALKRALESRPPQASSS